jgi:hypothetical protein
MTRDESRFDPDDVLREIDSPKPDDGQSVEEPTAHEETPGTNDEGLGDSATKPADVPLGNSPNAAEMPVDEPALSPSSPSPVPPSASSPAQIDGATVAPAPGYAQGVTNNLGWAGGRVDPAYCELLKLNHGLRPVFEPEPNEANVGQPPQPPILVRQNDGGSSSSILIDVRVSLTHEERERIAKGSIRNAAQFSRAETLIVARKLEEHIVEFRTLEAERRAVWGR